MSSVYPLNNELSQLTTLEEANEVAPKVMFLRKRLSALALDSVVIGFLSTTFLSLATLGLSLVSNGETTLDLSLKILAITFMLGATDSLTGGGLVVLVLVYWVLYLFDPLLLRPFDGRSIFLGAACAVMANYQYHVLFDASPLRATPGKLVVGLKISQTNGEQLSSKQASFRHSTKILSLLSMLLAPITLLVFCNRRQLIHDRIAGSLVDLRDSILPLKIAPETGTGTALTSANPRQSPAPKSCAGIPRRIVSAGIDSIVYYVCEGVSVVAIAIFLASFFPFNFHWFSYSWINELLPLLLIGAISTLCGTVVPMLVFAAFESSNLQASPGKIIAGMRVVNVTGAKTSFWQAFEKQFIQGFIYLSLVPTCSFALLLISVLRAPQLWAVLAFAVFYLVYGMVLCFTFGSGQTLVDRWSKRYVVLEPPSQNEALILKDRGGLL